MRVRWLLIGVVVLVVAVVVDAATRSHRRTGGTAPAQTVVDGQRVLNPAGSLPITPGAASSPRAVLYRFATAYSEVSSSTAAQRDSLMLSLAAPPLLTRLRAAGPGSELTSQSAVLRRTSIDSLLVGLRVTAPSAGVVHGSVEIKQWLVGQRESGVPPMQSSYNADLIQVGGAWRVSQFTLVP